MPRKWVSPKRQVYNAVQQQFYLEVVDGASLPELSEKYKVSIPTITEWRNKALKDNAPLDPKYFESIKQRHFSMTLARLDKVEVRAFKLAMSSNQPGAIRDFCLVIKAKSELLSRFGVIPRLEEGSTNVTVFNMQQYIEELRKSLDSPERETKEVRNENDGH
jgi:hypothetical protein